MNVKDCSTVYRTNKHLFKQTRNINKYIDDNLYHYRNLGATYLYL